MLLKSLEIQGFKTFPDKTKLTFDKGITSIVGPNGSGKSNISDAIRWVLGEQSPKAIRCSKMEDVVFNGTDSRKKQGYAQVTLSFDNSDRTLAFDGDEVSITRRYYRSGDSDYMINKASVRLKDIHELFMDTGLGRDGYSMIGQGKIDSIVSSKSEDRREIFEEASGISRYRYRKLEAEKKLQSTEENLVRLRDILKELDDRIEPLRIQSEKAEKFLQYAEEKKGVEIALWLDTIRQSANVLREQEEKLEIAKSQHDRAEKDLENIRKESEELSEEISRFEQSIEEIRKEIALCEKQSAKGKADVSISKNDIEHNNDNIFRLKKEKESIENSSKTVQKEIEEKKTRIAEYEKTMRQLTAECLKDEEELRTVMTNATQKSEQLQTISLQLATLTAKSADIKVSAMTSMSAVTEAKERTANLNNSRVSRQQNIKEIEQRCQDYETMLNQSAQQIQRLTNILSGCRLKLQNRQKSREELKTATDKFNLDYQERLRRIKVLEDLERNMEGFYTSVKMVMKEAQRGNLKGIHGPVSRVINVPEEYTVAMETALGNSMQHIVTDNEESAKNAIQYLKQRDGGRATFLPLTTIKGNVLNERGLEQCNGFVGIASELCSCDTMYNGILHSLLGRIAIADNLNHAVEIARKYGYKFRIVTIDGQVINAGGSLTGGSQGRKSGLLSRAGEIKKNREIAEKLKQKFEQSSENYQQAVKEYAKAEAEVLASSAELSKAQEEKIKIEAELKSSKTERENMKKSLAEIENEISVLDIKIKRQSEIHRNSQRELEKITTEIAETERQSETLTGTQILLTEKRETISRKIQNIRLEIVGYEKDIENIRSEINLALTNENTKEQRKQSLDSQITDYQNKNKTIILHIQEVNQSLENILLQIKDLQGKIESISRKKKETENKIAQLRQSERDKLNERELSGREYSKLEERKLNLQKQYDDIIAKLWEEYELTPREAEHHAVVIESVTVAKKRLNELKSKIKSLGNVNVSAIEEYKEVSERHKFMTEQVGDIEKSKSEILKLIGDLTRQMKELFVEKFNNINEHFSKTFVELFGGGKARLELTNPEDVLTSGIEIIVHPPGKIVVHLEALSGGEKALVAIALYFAIMKVSPAPFCVMDEIEAALDEVNVDRFAQYLRVMNDRTQFILITHRRGTMEEADVLYGVTMQDKGISKLLSLKVSEVSQKLNLKS